MKLILSPLVAALRGRAGGAVCAVTRGVQYVKAHAHPGGPPSAAQLEHRAHIARLADWWRGLPTVMREFLDLLAAENNTTGYALFSKTNATHRSPGPEPILVPKNKHVAQAGWIQAIPGTYDHDLHISWGLGKADANHFIRFFTLSVHRLILPGEKEADLWRWHPSHLITHLQPIVLIELNPDTEYWIVAIVAPHDHWPPGLKMSGGVITTCKTNPGPV